MRFTVFFSFCVMVLTLTGCAGAFDPFQRPGNWSATGASRENIAQQAANKSDLISGQSEPTSNGIAATGALDEALGANGAGTAAGLQKTLQPTSIYTDTSSGN